MRGPRELGPGEFHSLGWELIAWVETYLVHGPGDVQGEPVELDDEMAAFLLRCYEVDAHGRRVHDEALLSRAKGRAKTELAAMIACAEAVGPVRFDGWNAAGEPVGRPITYPFVRCLATEEDQSGNTFGSAAFMLDHLAGAEPGEFGGIDIGRDWQSSTRIFIPGGGEVVPSTASSAAKDGGKETFVVYDETHLYVTNELRRMYRTVKRNLAKRRAAQPWALQTSTMHAPGEESICEATHAAAAAGKAPRLLLDHRGARSRIDLADTDAVLAELAWVYGDAAGWMDLGRILDELRDPTADEADQRRYFLNEEVTGSSRWLGKSVWSGLARPDVVVADGDPVTLGFDGSISRDSSALVGCTRDAHLFVVGFWERPDGPAGEKWVVPAGEVDAAVAEAFDRWQVARMYCDPAWWQPWVVRWAERHGDQRVVQWWTTGETRWARALLALYVAATSDPPELSHDGDSRLARHVANAHKRVTRGRDEEGRRLYVIQKDRPDSPRKIDGAVAATLAHHARADALAAGELLRVEATYPSITLA